MKRFAPGGPAVKAKNKGKKRWEKKEKKRKWKNKRLCSAPKDGMCFETVFRITQTLVLISTQRRKEKKRKEKKRKEKKRKGKILNIPHSSPLRFVAVVEEQAEMTHPHRGG